MSEQIPSLTLHQLQIFRAIAREGSFTRAAQALSLSEPTVSQQIKLLEGAVGVRLLDRASRRSLQLTGAGRLLLAGSNTMLELLESTIREIDAFKRAEGGLVTFGAGTHFCGHILPGLYAEFQQFAPQITVRVHTGSRDYLLDAVAQRQLDLAVVNDPIDDSRISSARLAALDLVLVGPLGHRLAGGTIAPFSALAQEPLILVDQVSSGTKELERKAAEVGVALQVSWEAASVEAQVNAIVKGLGIGPVPFYAVSSHIAGETLCLLRVEGFPMRFDWFITWRKGELSTPARLFKDHILEHQAELEAYAVYRS